MDQLPAETLPITLLAPGDSPRLSGVNLEHVKALAEHEGRLPPIVAHRRTLRVIDGVHRLQAARLRGDDEIEVCFFDGDEEAAFVLAVEANVTHGLPLALPDRTAAAARIIAVHPQWSDRAIATTTGLAAATVAGIRQRTTTRQGQLSARIGRDGRVRPLNSADGRRRAGELLRSRPDASLREIARAAGISPATVRDVRNRLHQGEDPVPPGQRRTERETTRLAGTERPDRPEEPAVILERLRKDPSLRFNDSRRILLMWLGEQAAGAQKWRNFLDRVPPHSTPLVAELARECAEMWNSFANELEKRPGAAPREA